MKRKKALYKSVMGVMLSAILISGTPVTALPGLSQLQVSKLPILSDLSIKANAESGSIESGRIDFFDDSGLLTLHGSFYGDAVRKASYKDKVKKIVADEGTILPKDCDKLFEGYVNCEIIDLSKADTSKVTNMSNMFADCKSLKTLPLQNFNTAKVEDMSFMFYGCKKLTSLNLKSFNTKNVSSMNNMFMACENLKTLDISSFNTSNVTDMLGLFSGCEKLGTINTGVLNTGKVTDMSDMFLGCRALKTLNLSNFDTSNVKKMQSMFCLCVNLQSLDISNFDTSNVTDMSYMFQDCGALKTLNLDGLNTSNVTDMRGMFTCCLELQSLDFTSFDTRKVTDMSMMFDSCTSLKELNLHSFNTTKVESMVAMFENCSQLTSLELDSFTTGTVKNMYRIFSDCTNLTKLDLHTFMINSDCMQDCMFYNLPSLKELTLGSGITEITKIHELSNGENGWTCGSRDNARISGKDEFATFSNNGFNTYYKITLLEGNIKMTGSPICKQKLSVSVATECPTKNLSYQWYRGKTILSQETSSTYTVKKEDVGKQLTCVITDKTGTYTGKLSITSDTVKKMSQDAPSGLNGVAPSKKGGSDGKIINVTTAMEYATKSDFSDKKACTSTSITGLKAGTYYVRFKETETAYASKSITVKVPEGVTPTPTPTPKPTPTPTPKPTPTPTPKPSKVDVTKVFKDVIKGQWYVSAVQFVYEKSIMNGTSKTTFSPLLPIERGQFVTVLYNMSGDTKTTFNKKQFKDVKETDFFAIPVTWAAKNKITSGTGDQMFSPYQDITREQMAVMLYKYAQFKNYKTTSSKNALKNFPDKVSVHDWATEAMQWAVTNKIINGKPTKNNNILDPLGNATRAECAQMIKNFVEKYEGN